jgi:hypothetical protein
MTLPRRPTLCACLAVSLLRARRPRRPAAEAILTDNGVRAQGSPDMTRIREQK